LSAPAGAPQNGGVHHVLSCLRRTLLVPAMLPLTGVAMGLAWLGTRLARGALGGEEGFVDEVRAGSLLFSGALVLSLAETLAVMRDARSGLLLLRAAKGGGFSLPARWLGLLLASLPTVALASLAGGGGLRVPPPVLADLAVLCAGGLFLGSWLERPLLVPALWCLLVAGHLRPWLADNPVAWVLPAFGQLGGAAGLLHAALWCASMLLLAEWRLGAVAARAA